MRLKFFTRAGLLSLAALCYSTSALALTCSSVGSSPWGDPATWDCGKVPSSSDTAVIMAGTAVMVDIAAVANGVTVGASGTLTFAAGQSLTIGNAGAGTGFLNNGTVTATDASFINIDTHASSAAVAFDNFGTFTLGSVITGAKLYVAGANTNGIHNSGTFTSGTGLITTNSLTNATTFTLGTGGMDISFLNGVASSDLSNAGTLNLHGNMTIAGNINTGNGSLLGGGKMILTDRDHTITGPVRVRNLEIATLTAPRTLNIVGTVTAEGTTALNGVSAQNSLTFSGSSTPSITAFSATNCYLAGSPILGISNCATFVQSYKLTLQTSGTGTGTLTGTTAGTYAQASPINVTATPNANSVFVAWTPSSCASTFNINADTTCSAQFNLKPVTSYQFTTQTSGTGKGTISGTASGTYAAGSNILVTATPDVNSVFIAWTPSSCATAFALNANASCSAQFDVKPVVIPPGAFYQFTAQTSGTGKGTISGTASGTYAAGSNILVTATPDVNSVFIAWTPSTCVSAFALNADQICSAQFDVKPVVIPPGTFYQFTEQTSGTGKGTISGTASGTYAAGSNILVTATPDVDSVFIAWTPSTCVSAFALNTNTTCSAQFDLKSIVIPPGAFYQFTAQTSGTGKGTISGTVSGTYAAGSNIKVTAAPDVNSVFVAWTPSNCAAAFALNANTTCSAQFDVKPVVIPPGTFYQFTAQTSGTGKGTISGTVSGTYAAGSNILVTAAPDVNSVFIAWTPSSCAAAFALNTDQICTAQFDLNPVITPPGVPGNPNPDNNPCVLNTVLNTSCNAAQVKTNITEITANGQLSNAIIDAPLLNQGWISDSYLTAKGEITGGTITGYLENKGIVWDVEFKGRYIKGGILAGKILNSSVEGYLENVTFAAGSSLNGGILQGIIRGDPSAPALLENVILKKGSVVSGVRFGKNVIVEDGVILLDYPYLPALEKVLGIDAAGNPQTTRSRFYGGISVSGKAYVQKATQLLSEYVSVRGRIIPEPAHIGQKVDLFVYSPYFESLPNVGNDRPYYLADEQSNILFWNQNPVDLIPFKRGVVLESVHELEMFVGHFIATGALNIVFGYRLEDGRMFVADFQNGIEVTIQ